MRGPVSDIMNCKSPMRGCVVDRWQMRGRVSEYMMNRNRQMRGRVVDTMLNRNAK